MSVDFLIGMTIFAGIFFFVFQFTSAAVAPYVTTSEGVPTKTQRVADHLYFDNLEGEKKGQLNLTYLEDNKGNIGQVMDDLGVGDDRYGMNITVSKVGSDGYELGIGESPPDAGASVSRTTRVGLVIDDGGVSGINQGDRVFVRVRVW
jgi:hypothetical protein